MTTGAATLVGANNVGDMFAPASAGCSLAYERLLKTTFGGDFARLMAWWRSARAAAPQREAPTRR